MSFLAPVAFVGLLLAIPIVLLYMLRLRRREVAVSSTFLWQQVLRDREANTPWQRLRRNLLLFLQLLILLLLVLALARPFIEVPTVSAGQLVLIIDASASMNATDSPDGTRFDEARRRALEIVDALAPGDTVTLIRAADPAEVILTATEDRAALRAALEALPAGVGRADWNAALTLAAASAAGVDDLTVVLITDGGIGEAERLPAIPGALQLVPVGRSGDNLAISALAVRSLPGLAPQLFAQITNHGPNDAEVILTLRIDGELFAAERVTVPGEDDLPFVSRALPPGFETVQASLTFPVGAPTIDYLPDDNTAWAVAPAAGDRRVLLVTEGNRFLEQVLRSLPGIEVFLAEPGALLPPPSDFALIFFDGWLPAALPAGDLFIINPTASTPLFSVGQELRRPDLLGEPDPTANIRVRREDPRMTFVDFAGVNLLAFNQVSAPWADVLIEADGGPLLLAGTVDGRQIAILTFDVRASDLPLQIAWPILMASLLDWFAPPALASGESFSIGAVIPLSAPPEATALRVLPPVDAPITLANDGRPLAFTETTSAGLYRIEALDASGAILDRGVFAVNLFAPEESAIAPRSTITLGDTLVTEATEPAVGQREFWPLLALLALAVLLIEWFAYHRRLRAPTTFRPLGRANGTRPKPARASQSR